MAIIALLTLVIGGTKAIGSPFDIIMKKIRASLLF